mmetsp:Transcript_6775/g.16886  ORF Transcript_6775/g.16886 Transcript_6775/m.16886 type:complete len:139 (+) Transcript_6775:51-467(+)|eukprot:CAMPEP_0206228686 /NCGR_PEP_ID=MMETSP0047_2-20121206/9299_1 /ASSEMBLY_ACC=CAM_ASM_000192 /TAXON_ID=195065 /ORGANISM="Chroomonas mesostigmatica_cf, Strain CCMP1168" /LENGTH=138 /DNA_ID=CAMNT_0053651941 /DNA_START=25 /DNA_END=441 /DNA_ORIENTATION=-
MVKINYGSAVESTPQRESVNVNRQLMAAAGIMGLALVVCCALVASAELKEQEVVMYGLGSGEEDAGSKGVLTAFETFKEQEEVVKDAVGKEYYVDEFAAAKEDAKTEEHIKEVEAVIGEAKAEHDILNTFAAGETPPA